MLSMSNTMNTALFEASAARFPDVHEAVCGGQNGPSSSAHTLESPKLVKLHRQRHAHEQQGSYLAQDHLGDEPREQCPAQDAQQSNRGQSQGSASKDPQRHFMLGRHPDHGQLGLVIGFDQRAGRTC